jgi:hypothetical protein
MTMSNASANGLIADFVLLRRFFTRQRLKYAWFVFLFVWFIQLTSYLFAFVNSFRHGVYAYSLIDFATWLSLTYSVLATMIFLLLARLLFEVALTLLPSEGQER